MTDFEPKLMDLIKANIDLQKDSSCEMLYSQLDWFKALDEGYLENLPVMGGKQYKSTFSKIFSDFDMIIGSDLIYESSGSESPIEPLVSLLTTLFPTKQLFIVHTERCPIIFKDLHSKMVEKFQSVQKIDIEEFEKCAMQGT